VHQIFGLHSFKGNGALWFYISPQHDFTLQLPIGACLLEVEDTRATVMLICPIYTNLVKILQGPAGSHLDYAYLKRTLSLVLELKCLYV